MTTRETVNSEDSGKCSAMSGMAGETAAPPISMSIDVRSIATSVTLVGVNRAPVRAGVMDSAK